MFTVALFIIVQNWKSTKCLSIGELYKKSYMLYYSIYIKI